MKTKCAIKKAYKLGEVIGKGCEGTVRRAVERKSGQEVAIKCIKK